MKITVMATFLILLAVVGCNDSGPVTVRQNAEEIHSSLKREFPNSRITVDDIEHQILAPKDTGHAIEFEGFYIVHCRDGIVWKSNMIKAATPQSMISVDNEMLTMTTLEGKSLLIPVATIHHIEFVGDYIKKEE